MGAGIRKTLWPLNGAEKNTNAPVAPQAANVYPQVGGSEGNIQHIKGELPATKVEIVQRNEFEAGNRRTNK